MCAGAGGQARGLELAGFGHEGVVEYDADCCRTLRLNRPEWTVHEGDLNIFDGRPYSGVELLAGGLPCPPFSIAGKQLGKDDERNLFPAAIRLVDEIRPQAVMIENVRGFLGAVFEDYRGFIRGELKKLGYEAHWRLLNASDYGVPQLRPRVIIVALRNDIKDAFEWPTPSPFDAPTVGNTLRDLMSANGWVGAKTWAQGADEIAPTLVGGSKKHGGPDLGPTRARKAWAMLGVNGKSIADEAPARDFVGMPRLTVRMAARIQGFDDAWQFSGRKTAAYRQVGNAFPPPVACAVASNLRQAIERRRVYRVAGW
jgi:DNA (cytosine-5)-methyltransferase 1